ncbi:Fic/DOC family N-terminal domain-containing protein [Arthrobacter sp. NPDC055138]
MPQTRGYYQAAVPRLIADAQVVLPAETIALADDASQKLARFDAEAGTIAAALASILLSSEAASSSEVESITFSARQVTLAEIGRSKSDSETDRRSVQVRLTAAGNTVLPAIDVALNDEFAGATSTL